MNHPSLLILRNDDNVLQGLKTLLRPQKFEFIEARPSFDPGRFFQRRSPDLVLIWSSRKNTSDGLKAVERIRRKNRCVPIILITRYSSESRAIAALRAGVNDYFKIPVSRKALLASFDRHLIYGSNPSPSALISNDACPYFHQPLIGDSNAMRETAAYLIQIAATDSTVLITGETGTGKELAAELIHCNSMRAGRPLVCVNCAALPENLVESELFGYDRGAFTGAVAAQKGKLEQAQGGTVLLDEIGDMTPYSQAKILRSIENKEVYPLGAQRPLPLDIRVVAATNQEPEELVARGIFRSDLYYRLSVARVHLPPLRDRPDDVPGLIDFYIKKLNRRHGRDVKGFTDDAMALLARYDWPGNVRELKNLVEATFISLPPRQVALADLPPAFRRKLQETDKLPRSEREKMLAALQATNWNKTNAARKLNWSRMTLYRKMAKYQIVENRIR
jgi:DNA-binding NtrC family response regulator